MQCKNTVRVSWLLLIPLVAMLLATQLGCRSAQEFREVAGPAVHSGVTDIVNGLVDGMFAVIDPDDTAGTEESTSTP